MEEGNAVRISTPEFSSLREPLNQNWCCLAVGMVGIIMFVAGMIYVLLFR